jgi:hypothetical protein
MRSGRDALVLQFAAGPARFPEALLPGMVVDAELVFWPSAHPLRALVHERRGEMKPMELMDSSTVTRRRWVGSLGSSAFRPFSVASFQRWRAMRPPSGSR